MGRRRRLVQEAGDELESMRQELAKTITGTHSKGHGVNGTLPPPSAFDPDEPDRDGYGVFERQRQAEMMHEQDEALDGVFKTVGNLRQQADEMGRELEEQGEILEDADKLADRVGGKLQNGIKRVGWVIKNNEGMETFDQSFLTTRKTDGALDTWSSCCIGVLIFVLILLLVLVLIL